MAGSTRWQTTQDPTPELARERFKVERELSDRLRHATAEERRGLYATVYDEFHKQFPYLRYLGETDGEAVQPEIPSRYYRLMRRFLNGDSVFLEVGPGDCAFAREVATHVRQVYAVDVSEHAMLRGGPLPPNMQAVVSDGCSVPVPAGTVDVAFSSNLIEHLHPDDALVQTRNVLDALKPGGIYMCITPNRLNGPHDVSCITGEPEAVGFHLKEYAYSELIPLMRQSGFEDVRGYVDLKGRFITPLPAAVMTGFESALTALPRRLQQRAKRPLPVRAMLLVRVVGRKPS
jgi:SAM-dependent methyltransferase